MLVMIMTTSVAALLTVAAVTVGSGSLRQGEHGRREEGARALADAGAGRALANLTNDPSYSTHTGSPVMDRAWVLAAARTAPLESTGEGEFVHVVPTTERTVFGVGYIPSRAAARETEIVRVSYSTVNPTGFGALATRGSLEVGGNARISGLSGSVHTNGDLDVTGSAAVSGDATAVGTYRQSAGATVGGTGAGGYPALSIPNVDPRSYRSFTGFDLCPDATVRSTGPGQPCTGTIVGSGLGSGWNGWDYTGVLWRVNSNTAGNAAVYVFESNVRISGSPGSTSSPWLTTIIVEGRLSGSTLQNGDVSITGNPTMRPFTSGIGVVTHRDFTSSGTSDMEGLFLVGEQVELTGTGTLHGQVLGAGTTNTSGSPVRGNDVRGTFSLYAVSTAPQVTGGVEPTDWREI